MIILGIDPGLSGALALLTPTTLEVFDVPSFKAKTRGREMNGPEVARWLDSQGCEASGLDEGENRSMIDHAFIESVAAMSRQGVASMFKFGYTAGRLRGIVEAHFIPVTLVSSQKWKRDLGVPREKDAARARASELFPSHSDLFVRVKDDGRAEAALIAEWGRRSLAAGEGA